MIRRDFLASALTGSLAAQVNPSDRASGVGEKLVSGTPHRGKTLALVTPHLDDGPIFASGTIAKMLREGATGYFIRTSNDEKDSFDLSLGETVLANERDTAAMIRALGLAKVFDLSYRNHRMDDLAPTELRAR